MGKLRDMFENICTKTDQFEEAGFMPYDEYLEVKARQEYYRQLEQQGQEDKEVSS